MSTTKPIVKIPKGKTVLIVEDSQQRITWFASKLIGCDITVATSPESAEKAVSERRYDMVFLDHDAIPELVDSFVVGADKLTFYRIAQILARQQYDGAVVIHSYNPVGANNMANLLQGRTEAYVLVQPFGSFELEVV